MRHVRLPSGEFLIDRFDALFDVIGEVTCQFTIHPISGTCLDGVEAIKHITLHHDELGDTIHHNTVTKGYEVNPSTTTLTTSDGTILMTEVTNLLASLIEQLCGERTSTYTCAVGLHDAKDLANLVRTDTQTCAGTRTNGVGRGDKRIRTEIHVEHRTLGTLTKDGLALTNGSVYLMLRINQVELTEILNALEPFLFYLSDVILEVERLQDSLMACLVSGILLLEMVQDITYAQTISRDLVCISRTNALTGSTYLILTLLCLIGSIQHTVGRHDEMSLLGDVQALL